MMTYAVLGAVYTAVIWVFGYGVGRALAKPKRDKSGKFIKRDLKCGQKPQKQNVEPPSCEDGGKSSIQ